MDQQLAEGIARSVTYKKLVKERSQFGLILTAVILICYLGFLYLVAFKKDFLATRLTDDGVTTLSIPVGLGMILITIILTGVYVRRANSKYDKLTTQVLKEAGR